MQRGQGGRDEFFGFGDPFAGFGGFGRPGSLMPSLFGGRGPFDDPFFNRPFGSMLGPSMFGPSMFGPSMFGSGGSPFGETSNSGFLEHQASQPNRPSRPIIIQELSSDDNEGDKSAQEKDNPKKHSRSSKDPFVQDPDEEMEDAEEMEEKKNRHLQYQNQYNLANSAQPQSHIYSFQSSTVTYGGHNGPYYTSSTTRRTGSDGVTVEESKEADTTTRKATHRFSRGLHDKGHSVTRKLGSDGRVDTMQTLHNLNEDELAGFDEVWKGKARKNLPGWNHGIDIHDRGNIGGSSSSSQNRQPSLGWTALPSTEQSHNPIRLRSQSGPNSFDGRP